MIRARVRRAALAALLVSAIAACGPPATPAPPVRATSVDMPKSYRFEPRHIIVSVGDTVTWTNSDDFSHSVKFLDGGLPTEPMVVAVGAAPVTYTFAQPGLFNYQCSFHPNDMKGSVTVEP